MSNFSISVGNQKVNLNVEGTLLRTARLQSEYYVPVDDPQVILNSLKQSDVRADLFTFVQGLQDRAPLYPYHHEMDRVAVLPISTYQHWFDKQLYFKPRNKLRKAQKAGIEVRLVEFTEELIRGIKEVYDESPTRQGKANKHFRKDFETLQREHSSFLDRSQFIGVYFQGEIVGFAKLTCTNSYAVIMNIVAKIAHRDKAPSNALIAKAVEVCADRKLPYLKYGVWGGRGLTDFKVANGFECFEIPRCFVPLTLKGKLALQLGLHRRLIERLPRGLIRLMSDLRRRLRPVKLLQTAEADR
jgi:hypothetical protein